MNTHEKTTSATADNPILSAALQMFNAAGISKTKQEQIVAILSGGEVREEERIVKRREAAQMLGIAPSRVDAFVYMGRLERAYAPGSQRALGIRLSSIRRFQASCTATPTATAKEA